MRDSGGGALVTAIVPTSGRATVADAVASALAQRKCNVAVNVVGNGTTAQSIRARLGALANDNRVTVRILPDPARGANAARNFGARTAGTEWIAFLDDDDTWHPEKLSRTLAAVPDGERNVIISHRFVARTLEEDYVWPRFLPGPDVITSRKNVQNREGHFVEYPSLSRERYFRDGFRARIKALTNFPFSAGVPAPSISSHQARGCPVALMSQRPLNCSSPQKAVRLPTTTNNNANKVFRIIPP